MCVYGDQSVEMDSYWAHFRLLVQSTYWRAPQARLLANTASCGVARVHQMTPLGEQSVSSVETVDGFIAEHDLRSAVDTVMGTVENALGDKASTSLEIIDGDFDGESLLEVMIRADLDPTSVCELDDEIHRQMFESIPLNKRVFLVVNFRVG
jgi:hypothetical protein